MRSRPSSMAALDKPWASRHPHRHSRRRCTDPLRPPSFLLHPPIPRRGVLRRRPEPVSEINVAQPPLSEGCETVSGMEHLLGYARVSTTDQQPHLQVDALERAGCYRVFTETASGARTDRPVLEQLLDRSGPATPWSSGSSTASAARSATWSRPSPAWPTAASGSAASRRRSTRPPPAASSSSTSSPPWPSSSATSSASGPAPGSPRPGPAAATAAGRRC